MTPEQRREFAASALAPHLWHAVKNAEGDEEMHDWTRLTAPTRQFWEFLALAVLDVLGDADVPGRAQLAAQFAARRTRHEFRLLKWPEGDEPA